MSARPWAWRIAEEPPLSGPRVFTARLGQALAWADDVHRGHLRKTTDIPYVSHLMSVAALVMEHGGS